jgi:hypothetical protein
MPARLHLADHLTEEARFARFQSAADPRARSHGQVLWMVGQAFPTEDIAVAVGYSPVWIRKRVGRYNEEGPAAMGDRRHHNPGAKRLLSADEEAALQAALQSPPPEGDGWSGPVVARWMSQRLGRAVSRFRGREGLVRPRYEWLWVVAFVCPESGATSFWLVPALTTEIFQLLLDAFAQEQGVGSGKRILLVLDQAGWHLSGELQIPEGLTLVFLPPYSPELQPAEHLWALVDAPVVHRLVGSLDELEAILSARIQVLSERPEQIRSTTLFHGWPRVSHP